ncbi:MAG: cytidylate kinase-like family protein [Dysgonamonadaceae bacterium]|jgi:cytidylate kinase|nr:cytidylate kinase-like family protein [Dysgonamonadaceae bacterium]
MTDNYIITIGRQLGSGGRTIGKMLAQQLEIPCYDRELIQMASQSSGLGKEFFEQADEKTKFHLFGNLLGWFSNPASYEGYLNNSLRNESLFQIQSDVIRNLASQHSCIFVGRCADYILRDFPHCVRVFVAADIADRIRRLTERESISADKAKEIIERTDRQRASYYNYYSNKTWGMATSYDLCINTSLLGLDSSVDFIRSFVEKNLEITLK